MRNLQYENLFKEWHITYRYVEQVDLESLQRNEKAQVREIAHIANRENVEKYAMQLQAGAEFPPLVVWNNQLIDGNTRRAAGLHIGRVHMSAYEVELDSIEMALALAAALNNLNGQPLTDDERRRNASTMIDLGFNDKQIALYLGIKADRARQWRRIEEVRQRAEKTGTTAMVEQMKPGMLTELAKVTHDGPFKDLITAVTECRPEIRDVKQVVEAMGQATSDEAESEVVAQAREDWRPIGPDPAKYRPNRKAQQMRMNLGALNKLLAEPEQLVDPARISTDMEKVEQIIEALRVLQTLLRSRDAGEAA